MNAKSETSLKSPKKIPLNDTIRSRIKELQHENNLSNAQAATTLGLSLDTYKNIVNNKNQNIDIALIKQIASTFKCTDDYIMGKSNDRTLNRDGIQIISPISRSETNKMISDITKYLYKDPETLRSIYLLLFRLPPLIQYNILETLNLFTQEIRITTLMDRKDSLSKEDFDNIVNALIKDNVEITMMNKKLVKANKELKRNRIKTALFIYLEIIYYASAYSTATAKKAIAAVIDLKRTWDKFPPELVPLITMLPEMQKNNFFNYPAEAEVIIRNFLSPHKGDLISREEYFSFSE